MRVIFKAQQATDAKKTSHCKHILKYVDCTLKFMNALSTKDKPSNHSTCIYTPTISLLTLEGFAIW